MYTSKSRLYYNFCMLTLIVWGWGIVQTILPNWGPLQTAILSWGPLQTAIPSWDSPLQMGAKKTLSFGLKNTNGYDEGSKGRT